MSKEMKRSRCHAPQFQVTRADGEAVPVIAGYAAVFNESTDLGWFTESIAPGAFTESLARGDDVRALFNHDPNLILGRTTARTLELREDEKGLFSRIHPPDTQLARDLVTSIERGDISQMSFGFYVEAEEAQIEQGKPTHFTITKASLFDVSPVTFPAYPTTEVDVQRCLRSRLERCGFSDIAARAAFEQRKREIELASRVFR